MFGGPQDFFPFLSLCVACQAELERYIRAHSSAVPSLALPPPSRVLWGGGSSSSLLLFVSSPLPHWGLVVLSALPAVFRSSPHWTSSIENLSSVFLARRWGIWLSFNPCPKLLMTALASCYTDVPPAQASFSSLTYLPWGLKVNLYLLWK